MAIVGDWKPISSAPKDQVILTDKGTARFIDLSQYGNVVITGWYLSKLDGTTPYCSKYGMEISRIEPTWWMVIPLNESI